MNENYKGSIELISGLKQKNNLDFPLMEASAVAFYETDSEGVTTEIRLPDKLKTLGISEAEKEKLVQDAIASTIKSEDFTSLKTDVKKNAEDITLIDNELDALKAQIEAETGDNKNLIVYYDSAAQKLYLYEKDENGEIEFDPGTGEVIKVNQLSETSIQGGGGSTGTGATYSLSLKVAENTKDKFSTLEGRPVSLAYTIKLTTKETDPITGEVTYTPITSEKVTYSIYKDNIYQRAVSEETIKDGSIDVTDLLSIGANNFKIIATVLEYIETVNDEGEKVTITIPTTSKAFWNVNVVNMKLEVPDAVWEATPKYAAASFVYTPIGALSKTIHFILDGTEIHTETTILNGTSLSYTIPMQSHGVHTLEVYCEGTIEDEVIKTDIYKYVLMFVDRASTIPIIRIKANKTAEQYSTSRIYFNVYDPMDEIANIVEIYEDDVLKATQTNVTQNEQYWDYKPQIEGTKRIKIKYLDIEEFVDIEVKKFPYTISPTLGDLMVDFVPTGRTNQDIDYNVFKNNAFTTVTNEDGETITEEIPMTWTFSDNFDWINGGWKVDENGDTYFCVKAGTSVDFNYLLFDKDNTIAKKDANGDYSIAGTGKAFKLIFKTANVAKPEAVWLSCKNAALNGTDVGLEMQAHNAYISSSFDTLEVPYSEEDIIELDLNITPITKFSATHEPDLTTKTISMIMPFEDGTPSKPQVITNPTTSFKQVEAKPITVGSEFCDVHIYRMKVYERYLTDAEILNNFIADSRSGEEMAKRYLRNQIYLEGQTQFGGKEQDLIKLAEACPDLRVYLLSAPQFTNDKGNKISETTIKQWYFKNGKDSIQDNWVATGCTHRGQGTSSNAYGYSGRNLDFDMKKATITLGDGRTTTKKIQLSPNSVPTNYLNFKANIASSENANNALLAKRYDRYLPYETVASLNGQENGVDVKNSMEFYNCVVFIQETNEDLSTHREFNDTSIHFYGIGNIGDSKKTDSSRLNDAEDEKEFCVEIMDWNRFLSSFPSNTMINAMGFTIDPNTQEKIYTWATDDNLDILYELIDGEYVLTKDTTVDLSKIYYVDILEQDDFSEDFTYGWRYITEYETDTEKVSSEEAEINKQKNKEIHNAAHQVWKDFYRFVTRDLTTDGKEDTAKVNAWKKEFADWFILDSALYYFLFTLRYTMVDNRAKNSFWHYGKCPDGKYRFEFWDYDNDTALGIDNTGVLAIPYGVEESDKDSTGSPYFRAHESTFFVRVAKYFNAEAISLWNRIEGNVNVGNAFDSTNFIKEFDDWQLQFPEELWRLDYERKYKRTYVGGEGPDWDNALPKIVDGKKVVETDFLANKMNGRKKYQRRQFERKQDTYMSSKFRGSKNLDDSLRIRGSGGSTDHAIPADYTLKITPFNNMYLNLLDDGSNMIYHKRVFAGQEEVINLLDYVNTLDALNIKGGSSIQSLGDLSLLYLREAGLAAGSKLKMAILGNNSPDYDNTALNVITLGDSNKLLETLNICNLKSITEVEFTKIPSLKKVYAQGSSLMSARFANNGLLEEAYLPATITQLELRNLYFLHTLEVENYTNLTDLTVENCVNVDTLNIINQAPKLNTLRVTNIEWTFETTDILNKLYSIDSIITGYVHVDAIRQSELDAYAKKWPELEIHWNDIITQYNLNFYNEGADISSDEPIYTYKVDENTLLYPELYDPAKNGMLKPEQLPTKPDSEDGQFEYKFKGWNPSMEPTIVNGEEKYIPVTQDMNFFADFEAVTKMYTISWYGYNRKLLQTSTVPYGGTGIYTGEIPTRANQVNAYFLFNGWDSSSANITGNKEIIANWIQANPGSLSSSNSEELHSVEIYSLAQNAKDTNNTSLYNEILGLDKKIKVQMGYMPDFENVTSTVFEEAMKEYNGLKSDVVVTDKYLFDKTHLEKGFTLAIDFTPKYQTSKDNVFVSCYNSQLFGFKLQSPSNIPQFMWNSNILKLYGAKNGYTTSETYNNFREICVIRYSAEEKTIYFYTNDRYSLDDIYEQKITLPITNWEYSFAPLTFGGNVDEDGTYSTLSYMSGIIHYAKLWEDDLGSEECKKICSWVYDEYEFEQVTDRTRYQYSSTSEEGSKLFNTTASFVATELMERPVNFFAALDYSNKYPGWHASQIRTWLNTKVLKGMSLEWQQILLPTVIYSLGNQGDSNLPSIDGDTAETYYNQMSTIDKLYIPALAEIIPNPSANSTSKAEKYLDDLGGARNLSSYPQYTEDNSGRIRNLKGTDISFGWWTRTPSLNNPRYYKGVSSTGDTTSINYKHDKDPMKEPRYFYPHTTPDISKFQFNMPCSVLLAFSI